MFKRKAYNLLLEWKNTSNGKTAALIEGARRIGKSTVAQRFAEAEYEDYLLLDFSIESNDVKQNFKDNISDLDAFFRTLFLLKDKTLPKGNAVIIFDEVQFCPEARQAIKALVKDGRYHYIETGSLLSIKENTKGILLPSEEYKIKMYPMDFEEFLWAKGNAVAAESIRSAFEKLKPLGDPIHRKIMSEFRSYMAVGGMPQAVEVFVNGGTYQELDMAKRTIISLYEGDLRKYDSEVNGRVSAMFATLPQQLGADNKRFKFSAVKEGTRYTQLVNSLAFLKDSMIVNICTNVTAPDVLMSLYEEPEKFKMYMGDTGLLITQATGSDSAAKTALYKALDLNKTDANLGMVYENVVAQMLAARNHDLHFHVFDYQPEGNKRESNYEVDFLLLRGKRVCPIEVKSSGYKSHKSIDCFFEKYDVKADSRFVLYTKDLKRQGNVVYLPVYMAMCL